MGARPHVPHCPNEECKQRLRWFQWDSRYGTRLTTYRRPGIPTPVMPLQTKQRWQHRRLATLTLMRCPDCKREWWSTG